MKNKRSVELTHVLVLEIGKTASGAIRTIISIPGREGTVCTDYRSVDRWDDISATVLSALSDWLWLSGGHQEELPGSS